MTLDHTQLTTFLANTSGALGQYRDQLAGTLTELTNVTPQLRDNPSEIADLAPRVFQNIDHLSTARTSERESISSSPPLS
ncbi:hypothetical protein ACIA5H_36330 [Nocardia sp. NPDC051900]|uniref:hypothetical protein n=1 Tax=Nocardia sp. NPDC051900 TaxID=3364326 RepID=UPI00379A446F